MSTTANYTHYRHSSIQIGPIASEQTLYFEDYLTDEEVRAAIAPIPVVKFERPKGHSRAYVIATSVDSTILTRRLRDLGRQRYAELAPMWEAEREAKFQAYYRSLNLDPYIEIPSSYWDKEKGQKVESTIRVDTRTGKTVNSVGI